MSPLLNHPIQHLFQTVERMNSKVRLTYLHQISALRSPVQQFGETMFKKEP